jgi:hypothetical protein
MRPVTERRRLGWVPAAGLMVWAAGLGGCYGFAGGGLPPQLKTVAVLPFDNQTPEPALTQEINLAVRQAVEQRLGLRQAAQDNADVLVRGTIVRYEPDLPVAFTGTNGQQVVNVSRRLVQLSVSVEVIDQKLNKPVWQQGSILLEGDYDPGNEPAGRRKALDKLVTQIVQGAQSQW